MLNISEEITYYKDDDFFMDYLLGVRDSENSHESFENFKLVLHTKDNCFMLNVDFENKNERILMSDLLFETFKRSPNALSCFRCDFDFNMMPGELERFEKDYDEIVSLFDDYCKKFKTFGLVVNHFNQIDEVVEEEVPLTKHVHIVYAEAVGAPNFTEYVHKFII